VDFSTGKAKITTVGSIKNSIEGKLYTATITICNFVEKTWRIVEKLIVFVG
jgi:hypothetical protein